MVVLLLVGGCRQVFGIEDTTTVAIDAEGGGGDAALVDAPADGPPDADPLIGCPAEYDLVAPGEGRYRHVDVALDWIDAVVDCADDSPSSASVHTHLAVFATDAERAEVNAILQTTVWLGLTDRRVADQWIWVTQEPTGGYPPLSHPAWAPNEPDREGECGAMDENGRLEARRCDGQDDVPFLCECDVYPDDPSRY
jgi:hypothetical protein